MRILITTVKPNSAIDRLSTAVVNNLPHLEIKMLPVHPKRPSGETLHEWQKLMNWADILDFQYWRSAQMLLAMFPEARDKPKILTHHNPYDLQKDKWESYDKLIVKNQNQQAILPRAMVIPHAINLRFFKYLPEEKYTKEKTVGMVVGRIEGKKGVQEVAEVCKELGYKMILIGMVSEPEYMRNIMKTGVVEFREMIPEDQLYKAYTDMAVLVCNSEDNYESGPMPVLEAMATGIPVLTRDVGLVPDIFNGKNMSVRKGAKGDKEELKTELKNLMESDILRKRYREAAWESVKNRDERRSAIMYEKVWHQVLAKDKPIVSVIVTTADRPEVLIECLHAILNQDYNAKEVIVSDDGTDPKTKRVVEETRKYTNTPIKYIKTDNPERYGLATARNLAVIESIGDMLVFCDDRLRMKPGAIESFAKRIYSKKWLWGEKDLTKKGFVENFSAVMRKDLINGGMFNERITKYGGLTQDIRMRFERGQGLIFEFVPEAKAEAIIKSRSKWSKKDDIISSKTLLWKLYEQ
jgi:glycosyltransferase involved in cell wall biosynthesis